MRRKAEAPDALVNFIQTVGIPEHLITDNAPEEGRGPSTQWRNVVGTYHIHQTWTEPHSPWQNKAEGEIREVKRAIKRYSMRAKSPRRLWCFLGEYVTGIRRHTALDIPSLHGRTPHEAVKGWTPDISPWIQFSWYQWVYYLDHDGEQKLARWLVPAEDTGGGDCYWLLPISCWPIVRSTVWPVPDDELKNPMKIQEMTAFNEEVTRSIGDDGDLGDAAADFAPELPPYGDLFDEPDDTPEPMEPESAKEEADEHTDEAFDKYLTAQVLLPRDGETYQSGTVVRRVKDDASNPIGQRSQNPILDTCQYEVSFPDGSTQSYTANTIAKNLHAQIDDEGRQFSILKEIVDHRSNNSAIQISDGWTTTSKGNRSCKRTTRGWELLVA